VLDKPSAEQSSTAFPLQKYAFGAHLLFEHAPAEQNNPERLQFVVETTVNPSAEHTTADSFWHSVVPGVHAHGLHVAPNPAAVHVSRAPHATGVPRELPLAAHVTIALLTHCWRPAAQTSGAHVPRLQCSDWSQSPSCRHSAQAPSVGLQSNPKGVQSRSDWQSGRQEDAMHFCPTSQSPS
jgi:hypothetical protein